MVPGWVQCQINFDLGDISMNWYNLCHTQTDIVYIQILTNVFKLSPNWSCVSSDGPSNWLPEKMHSRIGCICLAFLHCVSSDGPSKNAPLNTCYHLFCNCNSLNHICSEQRLRALIRCAFSEFVCTVFQTCIPDQNKWKVFLNAYEGCVLSMPSFFCMQYMMGNIRTCK